VKTYLLKVSLIFLAIGIFGCQQSTGGQEQDGDDSIINHEEKEEYDISGTISEIGEENKSIRLQLTKKIKEDEEVIVITVSEETKIYNEKKEVTFEELTTGMEIKANLTGDVCLEPDPRICTAGEIMIE